MFHSQPLPGSGAVFSLVSISRPSARHFYLGGCSIYPGPNFGQEMGTKKLLSPGVLGKGAMLSTEVTTVLAPQVFTLKQSTEHRESKSGISGEWLLLR